MCLGQLTTMYLTHRQSDLYIKNCLCISPGWASDAHLAISSIGSATQAVSCYQGLSKPWSNLLSRRLAESPLYEDQAYAVWAGSLEAVGCSIAIAVRSATLDTAGALSDRRPRHRTAQAVHGVIPEIFGTSSSQFRARWCGTANNRCLHRMQMH